MGATGSSSLPTTKVYFAMAEPFSGLPLTRLCDDELPWEVVKRQTLQELIGLTQLHQKPSSAAASRLEGTTGLGSTKPVLTKQAQYCVDGDSEVESEDEDDDDDNSARSNSRSDHKQR